MKTSAIISTHDYVHTQKVNHNLPGNSLSTDISRYETYHPLDLRAATVPVFLQDGFSEPTRCTRALVYAPYVVGNLKENFKSDAPNEKSPTVVVAAGIHDMHNVQSVCVLQRINIYTCYSELCGVSNIYSTCVSECVLTLHSSLEHVHT